jgi:DNA-binding MarR family transcriptional regulator
LTDSINDLVARGLVSRHQDTADRRRQLVEITADGLDLLDRDRADRDAWLEGAMRERLTDLERDLLMLVAPILRKLARAESRG